MSDVQPFATLAEMEHLSQRPQGAKWFADSKIIQVREDQYVRLLATAKQGVEAVQLLADARRDDEAQLAALGDRDVCIDRLNADLAAICDALGVQDEEANMARDAAVERVRQLRGGNQGGVLPAAPPKTTIEVGPEHWSRQGPSAAAVERGVRETSDNEGPTPEEVDAALRLFYGVQFDHMSGDERADEFDPMYAVLAAYRRERPNVRTQSSGRDSKGGSE